VATFSWVWTKLDDMTTPLDELIRRLNTGLKKLENAFTQSVTALIQVSTFTNGATTPNVSQASVWKTNNSAPTTITNFTGGEAGKLFTLVARDGNTTIQNNANILTKTGANRALANGNVTQFVTDDGAVWREVPTP